MMDVLKQDPGILVIAASITAAIRLNGKSVKYRAEVGVSR